MPVSLLFDSVEAFYGHRRVLGPISVRFDPGVVAVVAGGNGAGKSTLLALAAGLPIEHTGRIVALDGSAESVWEGTACGYMGHRPGLYPHLTVGENLDLFEGLARARSAWAAGARTEVVAALGLGPLMDRRARALSHGEAKRAGIARALLTSGGWAVLDEPFAGLEERWVVAVRRLLDGFARHGGGVLASAQGTPAGAAAKVFWMSRGRLSLYPDGGDGP